MIEDKNIDRLFQEQLKDMEVTPNPKVWLAIEKNLKNKKRRVIPIWWPYSGVASVLILGLLLFSNGFEKEEKQNNNFPVLTEQNVDENIKKEDQKEKENSIFSTENEVVIQGKKNELKEDVKIIVDKGKESNVIATKQRTASKKPIKEEKEKYIKTSEEGIVKGITSSEKIVAIKNSHHQQKESINDLLKNDFIFVDETIAEKEKVKKSEEDIVKGTSSDIITPNKKRNFSEKQEKKKDFIATIHKNIEDEEQEKKQVKKWAVSPVFGILQSNSFTETSALDTSLKDNEVSGESTFSYGVDFVYKLNSRWSLKSGIQLQKTAFTTKNISLIPSAVLAANSFDNVNYFNPNSELSYSVDDLGTENGADTATEQAQLQQTYGYIEIPLEVKYLFFESKKIKTSVISGFSSLFLAENSIVGKSANFSGSIGEATNLNGVNFSGNLGVDVDFMLTRKLNLNINPMFKAQLNTFSKNSNGFKPYILGIYTGIKYEF